MALHPVLHECPTCGTAFTGDARRRYCSDQCMRTAHDARRREFRSDYPDEYMMRIYACPKCGAVEDRTAMPGRMPTKCKACAPAPKRRIEKQVERLCVICNRTFLARSHRACVCSTECKRKHAARRANKLDRERKRDLPDRVGACIDCGAELRKPASHRGYLPRRCDTCGTIRRTAQVVRKEAARRLRRYGLTVEQYEAMRAAQGDRCACCGRTEPGGTGTWHIDHDHKTGRVRTLLCDRCNKVVGAVKEDVDIAIAIAKYIARYCRTELTAVG
jgi:hypothetical protein